MTYRNANRTFAGKLGGPQGKRGHVPNNCAQCGMHHRRQKGKTLCASCDPECAEWKRQHERRRELMQWEER